MKVLRVVFIALMAMASQWTPAQEPAKPADGHAVFDKWCAPCHAPGPFHGGTAGLQAKYQDKEPAALEQRRDLTPEVIRFYVRNGLNAMPPFRKTEVSDAELDAVARYLSAKDAKPKRPAH
jgi:(+)-pinoresinol hydroxylase